MNTINKIPFTSGTIEKLSFDYYTLVLFNGAQKVYAATIERLQATALIDKYYPSKINYIK